MGILRTLQLSLEGLHDIETDLDVRAYVVDDEVRAAIPGAIPELPEQLFLLEEDGTMEIALYVDPQVITRLERDDPHARLHDGNLAAYCVAVEGVSHFVLVAHRARLGRPVSALEMEIQAEVDKFVNAWRLLVAQGKAPAGAANLLRRRLFESWKLHAEVRDEERDRYQVANRVAKRYCGGLAGRYGRDRDGRRLEREVRAFFRDGLAGKLRAA